MPEGANPPGMDPTGVEGDIFDPPVFITEALQRRPAKRTDYLREKQAIQELAGRMAEQPEEVLPHFVDLAMEMTGGIAAGISLYEDDPAPGHFRWRYLRGAFAGFDGALTPRHFSPCGITLDRMTPILTAHSERMYGWISDANIVVPEVLLVPLFVGGKAPLGTLWIASDRQEHFDAGHARVVTELGTFVGIAIHMLRTQQRLARALDEQAVLAAEMNHRVKNAFALIDGIIQFSRKGVTTPDEMAKVLSGRLRALADAHSLVSRGPGERRTGEPAPDLAALLRTIMIPFEGGTDRPRVTIAGPAIRCRDDAVTGVALMFHELATNSAKYGALGAERGHVGLAWAREGDDLVFRWVEQGGPTIAAAPESVGFGSRLLQGTLDRQFGGRLVTEWNSAGLRATIAMPIARLAGEAAAAQ